MNLNFRRLHDNIIILLYKYMGEPHIAHAKTRDECVSQNPFSRRLYMMRVRARYIIIIRPKYGRDREGGVFEKKKKSSSCENCEKNTLLIVFYSFFFFLYNIYTLHIAICARCI